MRTTYFAIILSLEVTTLSALSLPPFLTKRWGPWMPDIGDNWQTVFDGPFKFPQSLDPDVSVYGLDLWSNNKPTVKKLQKSGKHVICSFSSGTVKPSDPDRKSFVKKDIGTQTDLPNGEKWVNVKSRGVRKTITKRVKVAADKGCNAISPRNTNAYDLDTVFNLSEDDEIDYIEFLANEAAKYHMSTGVDIGATAIDLQDIVSFFIGEACDDSSGDTDGSDDSEGGDGSDD
ncbi:endo alpha polygalactosaminidase precursor [Fusarium subglutinans]|uniref:alpha-galactosidase n=1 Tax=Gibberella subglutinans TaxID=42677 RepID=A0A8H5PV94_GIBSU|nr:endo alpha polygalactosaminidase precursor [Fusarium subglutinans]KAF5602873.1 endo alpha polygalactosaminidase precursor [Fusarium subglutinans]